MILRRHKQKAVQNQTKPVEPVKEEAKETKEKETKKGRKRGGET